MSSRITHGPQWLETLLEIYYELPWRKIHDWVIIPLLAFMLAVGLVALFQPLYDIAKWKGLL